MDKGEWGTIPLPFYIGYLVFSLKNFANMPVHNCVTKGGHNG